MKEIGKWILNNKDWLFSGIGLLFISSLSTFIYHRYKNKKLTLKLDNVNAVIRLWIKTKATKQALHIVSFINKIFQKQVTILSLFISFIVILIISTVLGAYMLNKTKYFSITIHKNLKPFSIKPITLDLKVKEGSDLSLREDSPPASISANVFFSSSNFHNESHFKTFNYITDTDNEELFSSLPVISEQGKLMFTIKPCMSGKALVCARQKNEKEGTNSKGIYVNTSHCIEIYVAACNDKPTFEVSQKNLYFLAYEKQQISRFIINISAGECELDQTVRYFLISTNNDSLFDDLPVISTDGTLTYKPSKDFLVNKSVTIYVEAVDDAIIPGAFTSDKKSFTIHNAVPVKNE